MRGIFKDHLYLMFKYFFLYFHFSKLIILFLFQVFGSKADLQLHTQVHMREPKPYKCTQCSKSFANSSYLSQHMRIHLGIKPYRCEICQRKFTQLSHLQQHIRTHTGDKPYKCRHPGNYFLNSSHKCSKCYKCIILTFINVF